MAFLNSTFNKIVRALRLDSKFLFETAENEMVLRAFAPLATKQHPQWKVIYDLGGIGLTAMMWLSAMDSALKFREHFDAIIRYEDLLKSKEHLVLGLLSKCSLAGNSSALSQTNLDAVFATDAHGENATTSSKRFRLGSGLPPCMNAWSVLTNLSRPTLHH